MPRAVTPEHDQAMIAMSGRAPGPRPTYRRLAVVPAAAAFVMMLPRWLSPTFGLLDDGFTLHWARTLGGVWTVVASLAPTGRFMPAHWVFCASVRAVVGKSPLGFFVVNYVMLCAIAVGLAGLLVRAGATRLQAVVGAALFILSGPAVETFSTLSKAEPAQLLWLVASLLSLASYANASSSGAKKLAALGMFTTLLIADATKETSLVMVPIAVAWVGLAWGAREGTSRERRQAGLAVYALAALAAACAFWILRAWTLGPHMMGGWYTTRYRFESATILRSLAYWTVFLVRDFGYLVPLVIFVAVLSVRRRRRPPALAMEATVWMTGWMAVFLPWGWAADYYLLPFTLGCATVGAMLLRDVVDLTRHARGLTRAGGMVALALAGGVWTLGVATQMSNARVQVAIDAANADMVARLATLPPASIVRVDLAEGHEYLAELPLHLADLHGRVDITVEAVTASPARSVPLAPVYLLTPHIAREPHPSMRLPFDERSVRARTALLGQGIAPSDLVYETGRRVRLLDVGFHHLLCRAVASRPAFGGVCDGEIPLVDRRVFSYGWKLYRGRPEPTS